MFSLQHLKREVFYLLSERVHEVCLSFLLIKFELCDAYCVCFTSRTLCLNGLSTGFTML